MNQIKKIKLIIFIELLIIVFLIYLSIMLIEKKDYHCQNCNLLLITMDSLRADHVGAYGYQRDTTPNIDLLAKKSIIFRNSIVNGPLTFYSLPSIMSSKYPIIKNKKIFYFILEDQDITLAEVLTKKNYSTGAFAVTPFARNTKSDKGFMVREYMIADDSLDDIEMNEKMISYIQNLSKQNKTFFVWIHFFSPHSPYAAPFPFNKTFYEDEFYGENTIKVNNLSNTLPSFIQNETELDFDYLVSQYDGEIRFIDSEVGKIIKILEKEELINNTLIVVSSDHGESFIEHKHYFDHGLLYDVELKVPLIIFNPKSDIKPKQINQQVQGIDFYPSFLDILDFKYNNSEIKGRSFYNLIVDKPYIERTSLLFSEDNQVGIRTRSWKLISSKSGYELYCLIFDKGEKHNLLAWYNYFFSPNSQAISD